MSDLTITEAAILLAQTRIRNFPSKMISHSNHITHYMADVVNIVTMSKRGESLAEEAVRDLDLYLRVCQELIEGMRSELDFYKREIK